MNFHRRNNRNTLNVLVTGHARTGKTSLIATLSALLADSSVRINFCDSVGLEMPSQLLSQTPPESAQEIAQHAAVEFTNPLISSIYSHFLKTLEEETKLKRNPRSPDTRIHLVLFLISPEIVLAAGGLTRSDTLALAQLAQLANVVVAIAKADLLTTRQTSKVRALINQSICTNNIPIYDFPEDAESPQSQSVHDNSDKENSDAPQTNSDAPTLTAPLATQTDAALMPFRIICSEQSDDQTVGIPVARPNGSSQLVFGREYSWGVVDALDPKHSDMQALINAVFDSHVDELIARTKDVLYEQWRTNHLTQIRNQLARSSRPPPVPIATKPQIPQKQTPPAHGSSSALYAHSQPPLQPIQRPIRSVFFRE